MLTQGFDCLLEFELAIPSASNASCSSSICRIIMHYIATRDKSDNSPRYLLTSRRVDPCAKVVVSVLFEKYTAEAANHSNLDRVDPQRKRQLHRSPPGPLQPRSRLPCLWSAPEDCFALKLLLYDRIERSLIAELKESDVNPHSDIHDWTTTKSALCRGNYMGVKDEIMFCFRRTFDISK